MNFRNLISIFLVLMILILPSVSALVPDQSMSIFAVGSSGNAMEATLNISIVEGTGKIYSSIDDSIVGSSTQESVKRAISSADLYLDEDISKNYNFTIDIESNAYSVDGPSAGSAMAFLIISMFEDLDVTNISMTGSISNDGFVGDVGGILEKSKKAGEIGIKLFFIPKGNRAQMINEDGEIFQVDLVEYIFDEYGMKIIEVEKIEEIMEFAKKDISSIDISSEELSEEEVYMPEGIKNSKAVLPMKDLVDKYIIEAEENLEITKENLLTTELEDSSIMQSMLSVINYAEDGLEKSKLYAESNFLYSAANNSFVTSVNLITVNEIISNPSIVSNDSTLFEMKLEDLEKKIKLTENRSNLCSLENMEWCIGARQRMTWARNKLENIKKSNYELKGPIEKITDYSYAMAWVDIANDFLDVGISDSGYKFLESNDFKDLAQQKIIDLENKLVVSDPEIATDTDFLRRIDAAKYNFKRGWYVSSLYDSATALSVLETIEENKSVVFDENLFLERFDFINNNLRSINAINSNENVWSKLYFDHAVYFYNSFEYYSNEDIEKAETNIKTANSILNIAYRLYEIEEEVLSYYNTADIQVIIQDTKKTDVDDDFVNNYNNPSDSQIVVYEKNNDNLIYIILFAFIVITLLVFVEVYRLNHNNKERIKRQISQIDEELLEGKISPFTYKELRSKYLHELNLLKEKELSKKKNKISGSSVKKEHISNISLNTNTEIKILTQQIEELEKRKKELSKAVKKKDTIKKVAIKRPKKKLSLKKNLSKK